MCQLLLPNGSEPMLLYKHMSLALFPFMLRLLVSTHQTKAYSTDVGPSRVEPRISDYRWSRLGHWGCLKSDDMIWRYQLYDLYMTGRGHWRSMSWYIEREAHSWRARGWKEDGCLGESWHMRLDKTQFRWILILIPGKEIFHPKSKIPTWICPSFSRARSC